MQKNNSTKLPPLWSFFQKIENQLFANRCRRRPKFFAECPGEIVRVGEPQFVGDFGDIEFGRAEQFFGFLQPYFLDKPDGAFPGEGFHFAEKLRVAQVDFPAEVFYTEVGVADFFVDGLEDLLHEKVVEGGFGAFSDGVT